MAINWPVEVELPDEIGAGRDFYAEGEPCCSRGHAKRAFRAIVPNEWYTAFRRCAAALREDPRVMTTVITYNDHRLTPAQRRIVYAAAWAMCGYVVGPGRAALALARKAEEQFGKVEVGA
jgi:hypothetical protein